MFDISIDHHTYSRYGPMAVRFWLKPLRGESYWNVDRATQTSSAVETNLSIDAIVDRHHLCRHCLRPLSWVLVLDPRH